jgi:hypothetical protein
MNIKLFFMSIWIPKFILNKELDQTAKIIDKYLDDLLKSYSISQPNIEKTLSTNIEERRLSMAKGHKLRLNCLIEELGFESSLKVGRKELFKAGYIMGCEAKDRLNVKTINDAVVAAHIIYKILGINFTVEKKEQQLVFNINSCDLASQYSAETCKIMSATDEGVLKGLNSNMDMKFKTRITEGAKECTACIDIKKNNGETL